MIFSEDQLRNFSKPLSNTEEARCRSAIKMVANALVSSGYIDKSINMGYDGLDKIEKRIKHKGKKYDLRLQLQGSYANNTNIKKNSDVDILIIQEDCFRAKYRPGVSREDYGFDSVDSKHKDLKNDIEKALRCYFKDRIERHNKSIKIRENNYIVNTDVVPSLQYRDYSNDFDFDKKNYISGILIISDDGQEIINYPEVHKKNGIDKNNKTHRRYKKAVRIVKKIYESMEEIEGISSYGIECLLYNVPDNIYNSNSNKYSVIIEDIINWLLDNNQLIDDFTEVNEMRRLCESEREKNTYIYFIKNIKDFYQYER